MVTRFNFKYVSDEEALHAEIEKLKAALEAERVYGRRNARVAAQRTCQRSCESCSMQVSASC